MFDKKKQPQTVLTKEKQSLFSSNKYQLQKHNIFISVYEYTK